MPVNIPLASAIENLRAELLKALEKGRGQELQFRLKPVELELNVAITEDAEVSGGIKFWVLNFGGNVAEQDSRTHKLKVVLEPVSSDGRSEFLISQTGVPEPGSGREKEDGST